MKKESKNYRGHYSRFILLIIFILLIASRTLAQCAQNTTCPCELSSLDIESSCVNGCPTYQTHRTDLANNAYGLSNVANVTIKATGPFLGAPVTVEVVHITLYEPVGAGCSAVAGQPVGGYTPTTFTAAGYNINFSTAGATVTITTPGGITVPIGWFVDFIVNVSDASGLVTSRNYFFEITDAAHIVGDPHITTVEGIHYDFQAVGEFTVLRKGSGDGFEIQIRQTAVATNGPITDSYSGLTTCVSLNTAVAARVGKHRVTYQPNINGKPDSSGMQLRVDGKLTTLGENGLDLGSGGRIVKASAGAGIQIDFPDGASLVATSNWWSHYSVWYLNVNVYRTGATKGIMGVLAVNKTTPGIASSNISSKSWLPALPDGRSLGPKPISPQARFDTLYKTFANEWRVNDNTSLFDYDTASGKNTNSFTNKNWPVENATSCSIPGQTPQTPIELAVAVQLTSGILDSNLRANAIADMMATGEAGFANAYLVTQQIQTGTTATILRVSKDTTNHGDSVTFTAIVVRKFSAEKGLTGSVEFTADGEKLGQVKLEANGLAILTTTSLKGGRHQIVAKFIPDSGSTAFSSSSPDVTHTVVGGTPIWQQWWLWAFLLLLIIIIIVIIRRRGRP